MAEGRSWVAAQLLEELRSSASEAPSVDDARWAHREAAVLLDAFDAATLDVPGRDVDDRERSRFLVEDCERVASRAGPMWRLHADVRAATVRRLGSPQRLLATVEGRPPDPQHVGRAMAEAYLRGDAPPLARQTLAQLHGTATAIEWLRGLDLGLPDGAEVRRQRSVAAVLDPLRTLLDGPFVGREAELRRIAEYVEVLPPGSRRSAGRRLLRQIFGLHERPPLVVRGPGGVGKSTLMARFVLDHAELDGQRRVPFAYLTFDRRDLDPHEPLTLLAEAIKQLAGMFPDVAPEATVLTELIRRTLRRQVSVKQQAGFEHASSKRAMTTLSLRDDQTLLSRYSGLVDTALGVGPRDHNRDTPLLWVLDTFEVVQRQGLTAVLSVWDFLDALQAVHPRLRVVFAGRAPLEGHRTDDLELGGFDADTALDFLRGHLDGVDVADGFLRAVAKRVRRNPLSLKLAAEVLRREGAAALREVTRQRQVLRALDAEVVQGILYRRILDHLEDEELRRIASPGLVMRRITPEVIREVLAAACRLGDVSDERAWDLYQRLATEASLVTSTGDALVHRADVRAVMLPLLRRDDPATVDRIHRRAIAFYRARPDFTDRAEELYHRLALGQATSTLDRYWMPDAAPLLEPAMDELPASSRAYLAEKLGLTVDTETLAQADAAAWTRQVRRIAREHLDGGRPDAALEVLRARRPEAAGAEIVALEAEALALLGRMDEARAVVRAGLEGPFEAEDLRGYVALLLLGARLAEDVERYEEVEALAVEAQSAARSADDRSLALSADVARLRLCRRTGSDPELEAELHEEVAEAAARLTVRERSRNPSLVRDLAAEVGDAVPDLLLDAMGVHGLDLSGDAGRVFDEVLTDEELADLLTFLGVPAPGGETITAGAGSQVLEEQSDALAKYARSAFASPKHAGHWTEALMRAYQTTVDAPAFVAHREGSTR